MNKKLYFPQKFHGERIYGIYFIAIASVRLFYLNWAPMYVSILSTEIGQLVIQGTDSLIYAINFSDELMEPNPNFLTEQAKQVLQEYFDLKRSHFDFSMLQRGTDFQQNVWKHLLAVEAGNPISYAALSKRMNHPLAIRAVAAANARNKLMIVVPCHRIIGSSGALVGYAAGLWRKKWLLEHEVKLTGMGQSKFIFST